MPESFAENRDSTLVKSGSGLSGVYYQPSAFRVGRHRGEHQVIFVPTAHSLANLASAGVVYVGLTYIGKRAHREYVTALKNSKVIKLIPIIIVANKRQGKLAVAERVCAACASDDERDHIDRYRRANIKAFQVNYSWGLAIHPGEIYRQASCYCLRRDGHLGE